MSSQFDALLISRIKRKLAENDERLVKARKRWAQQYGPYYIVDASNRIVSSGWHVDDLAQDLGLTQ